MDAFYGDRSNPYLETPEAELWASVLESYATDIRMSAIHMERGRAESIIRGLIAEARLEDWLCGALDLDNEFFVEQLEKLARKLGFEQSI